MYDTILLASLYLVPPTVNDVDLPIIVQCTDNSHSWFPRPRTMDLAQNTNTNDQMLTLHVGYSSVCLSVTTLLWSHMFYMGPARSVPSDWNSPNQHPQVRYMDFYAIAIRIIRCRKGLAHNVVMGLMGMGLCHFKGKNVVDCVATLHSILHFLGHCTPRSQTPPMLNKILVDAFLCCSNPVFVQYIRNLADFHTGEIDEHKKLFSKVQSGLLQWAFHGTQ